MKNQQYGASLADRVVMLEPIAKAVRMPEPAIAQVNPVEIARSSSQQD